MNATKPTQAISASRSCPEDFALSVNNLAKSFFLASNKAVQVLRDVSFTVKAGEIVAVMGSSGAGKSTLLHLLGGLETPDQGSISVDHNTNILKQAGFVFQFHYLLPDLTALENVSLPLFIERVPAMNATERAVEELEHVGLGDRLAQKVGYLSGGEQQRVAIARALITRPKLVLADEPTGNLDTSIASEIGKLLGKYAHTEHAVVVIATHNHQIASTCDSILTLKDGQIHLGPPGISSAAGTT